MKLLERINAELTQAMKARAMGKVSTLRMLKAALSAEEIQKNKETLEDAEVIDVIVKSIKQHGESITAFTKGNRPDLVQKEQDELEILRSYMPEAMPEAELRRLVQRAVQQLGVSGLAGMGQVMKAVLAEVGGRADGKLINQIVKEALGAV